MLSDEDVFRVRHERLQSVFQHVPLTLSVSMLNAVLVAVVLGAAAGSKGPLLWAAAMIAISIVRWKGSRAFQRGAVLRSGSRERVDQAWAVFSVLGSTTTGALWGLSAVALFPAAELQQLFLAFVIGGMCAGSITVNAAHLPTTLGFILPSSLPLAGSFLAQGTAGQVPALMTLIFATALSIIGLRSHRTFGEHIGLQLTLAREQQKLTEANARLLAEIAQRRVAEATLHQAQKMEAIGHLTGGIAHDFNNLLQVMIGNLDLIKRLSPDNPRVVGYADAADMAAQRGAQLTSSLLMFARRQTLEAQLMDVNQLIREFEPILLRTLAATIRCDITLTPDLPLCQVDPAHFQSAVLNFVINARDAMPNGGSLSISTGRTTLNAEDLAGNSDAHPGEFVSASVQDSGSGITAEVMERLFEPFFTTKDIGKGSGLGLSQAYGFARQSGGHVRLISTPNQGTTATLWLPVAKSGPHRGTASPAGSR